MCVGLAVTCLSVAPWASANPSPNVLAATIPSATTPNPVGALRTELNPAAANPLHGRALYVVPNNPAELAAAADPANAADLTKIASQPTSLWLTETTDLNLAALYLADANNQGRIPTFVLYAIPHRDCGGYSAGGYATATQYVEFINRIRSGLDGHQAIFVLEPDALPQLSVCGLTAVQQTERLNLIRYAATTLSSSQTPVYLAAGGKYSNPASVMAGRLTAAGVASTAGFALNISAYDTTAVETAFGNQLSALVGGKHFVIDTSRNGVGTPAGTPVGAFCNVPGLALGSAPTTTVDNPLTDAQLWLKYPGESDGDCGAGAPYSGVFWPGYAVSLVRNAA